MRQIKKFFKTRTRYRFNKELRKRYENNQLFT